jgi:hypothetical protein
MNFRGDLDLQPVQVSEGATFGLAALQECCHSRNILLSPRVSSEGDFNRAYLHKAEVSKCGFYIRWMVN